MTTTDDPFTAAQSDLLALLHQTRPLLASYLRIRSSASSSTSPELIEARTELSTNLSDLGADLQDLVDSVRAVEGDPYRFGLDVAEVSRRRQLVEDVSKEVQGMQRQLEQGVTTADMNNAALADPGEFDDQGDDDYGEWEAQRQMEMMHEQDEALDGVFQTVGNLRMQADTMGRELEEHAELLAETENITDRVGGKLGAGMKKIHSVIESNEDRYSSCCIAVLIFVLILLLILVLVL